MYLLYLQHENFQLTSFMISRTATDSAILKQVLFFMRYYISSRNVALYCARSIFANTESRLFLEYVLHL